MEGGCFSQRASGTHSECRTGATGSPNESRPRADPGLARGRVSPDPGASMHHDATITQQSAHSLWRQCAYKNESKVENHWDHEAGGENLSPRKPPSRQINNVVEQIKRRLRSSPNVSPKASSSSLRSSRVLASREERDVDGVVVGRRRRGLGRGCHRHVRMH